MINKKLSTEQIKHVARLANLNLENKEILQFQDQLSEILDYVDILNEVETRDVEPTSQTTQLHSVFREDKTAPGLSASEALGGVKNKVNTLVSVKKVWEN